MKTCLVLCTLVGVALAVVMVANPLVTATESAGYVGLPVTSWLMLFADQM